MKLHRPLHRLGLVASLMALASAGLVDPVPASEASAPAAAAPPAGQAAESLAVDLGPDATRTWVDVDADDRLDLFVADPLLGDHLFVQVEPGRFEDRFALSGLEELGASRSAAWSDFDGDTSPDVLRIAADGTARLWRNMGYGTFAEVTDLLSLPPGEVWEAGRWIDVDGDLLPDVEVAGAFGARVLHNQGGLQFAPSLLLPQAAPTPLPGFQNAPSANGTEPGSPGGEPGARPSGDFRGPGGGVTRPPTTLSSTVMVTGTTFAGPSSVLQLGPTCAPRVRDEATGNCLEASTTPTLGRLYPLSSSLFVSPSGHVGVGTTSPTFGTLHVKSSFSDPNVRLEGTGPDGLGGKLAFGATNASTYLAETEDDAIYMVAPQGVGIGPGNVGIHVSSLSEATHALTIKPNAGSVDVMRLIGPNGSFGHGAELNFGDGDYVRLSEDLDDHLLLHARQGTTVETTGVIATPSLEVKQTIGSGTSSPALRLDNSSTAAGIALFATTAGTDANTVLTQNGTGDLLRGFVNGALKFQMRNDGRMVVRSLEITGGSDLVENFDADVAVEPGTVLVIDPENPGRLTLTDETYDARVAGVASGAGGVEPGLHLRQEGVTDGAVPVAMTGRVYVKCSTENGAIRPGDLLTTASLSGYAMRASDPERSFGAVLGKAMTSLDEERGLVLVLVNLQ